MITIRNLKKFCNENKCNYSNLKYKLKREKKA